MQRIFLFFTWLLPQEQLEKWRETYNTFLLDMKDKNRVEKHVTKKAISVLADVVHLIQKKIDVMTAIIKIK